MQPPTVPTTAAAKARQPWTRRVALECWSRSVGTISLLATTTIALAAAFQGITVVWQYTILGLAFVAALPCLSIGIAQVAERRYLTRPSKPFLAAAFGLDVGGITLVAAAVILLQSETSYAAPMFAAGGVLEGCGTLLLLLWFVAVRVVASPDEHMHTL